MMEKQQSRPLHASVDNDEIAKFSALADEWWDPQGSFQPLHKLNPARLAYIRDRICANFDRDTADQHPLAGLRVADIGCGGGLLTEPMARLGAKVTGFDAAERNIMVARNHAERMGLVIDYRFATVENIADAGEQFDVVLNMEVVEHVADVAQFLDASCTLVRPGGMMFVATLNRTLKSFAFAIVGAEYVLRWLPRGTHDWRKFLRPSEMAAALRRGGLTEIAFTGLAFDALKDTWRIDERDISVNYLGCAVRPID